MRAYVRLSGGIGNQIFQVAFGDFLSSKRQLDVSYDISCFNGTDQLLSTTPRSFSSSLFDPGKNFGDFGINQVELTFLSGGKFNNVRIIRLAKKTVKNIRLALSSRFITHFKDGRLNIWKLFGNYFTHIYIGDWQDLNFISLDYRHEMNTILGQKINTLNLDDFSDFIGIHVRRSDYLNPNSIHHVLDINYYKKGLENLVLFTESKKILVFSDDVEWCEENLNSLGEIYFANDLGLDDSSELALMANLPFLIMANSSFSLAAALLGPSGKKIVAPSVWFNDKLSAKNHHFLDTWIVI